MFYTNKRVRTNSYARQGIEKFTPLPALSPGKHLNVKDKVALVINYDPSHENV
jgi:hypothetical protein